MFFRHLEPLLRPFRRARSKYVQAKQVKGNIKMDAKRVGHLKDMGKAGVKKGQDAAGKAGDQAKATKGKAGAAQGQIQGAAGGQAAPAPGAPAPPGAVAPPGAPAAPGAPPAPAGAINPNPGVKKVGLFGRKRVCEQCGQQLDKSWDSCPYCAQAAEAQQQPAEQKTQAFMIDAAGTGAPMQLLGWLVPLKGPQRGELYTLAPMSVVGTEPTCTVVLNDQYMSAQHAEIKAEGGTWILKDLGSTNGTYVNDKRIDQHELVDNDFVKFGQSLVKFKSL